jgi:hypothetical protein
MPVLISGIHLVILFILSKRSFTTAFLRRVLEGPATHEFESLAVASRPLQHEFTPIDQPVRANSCNSCLHPPSLKPSYGVAGGCFSSQSFWRIARSVQLDEEA